MPRKRMGAGYTDTRFLDLGTAWRVVNISPRPLTPGESVAGWVGPRNGLKDVEK
jgi:hypothetical protein